MTEELLRIDHTWQKNGWFHWINGPRQCLWAARRAYLHIEWIRLPVHGKVWKPGIQ